MASEVNCVRVMKGYARRVDYRSVEGLVNARIVTCELEDRQAAIIEGNNKVVLIHADKSTHWLDVQSEVHWVGHGASATIFNVLGKAKNTLLPCFKKIKGISVNIYHDSTQQIFHKSRASRVHVVIGENKITESGPISHHEEGNSDGSIDSYSCTLSKLSDIESFLRDKHVRLGPFVLKCWDDTTDEGEQRTIEEAKTCVRDTLKWLRFTEDHLNAEDSCNDLMNLGKHMKDNLRHRKLYKKLPDVELEKRCRQYVLLLDEQDILKVNKDDVMSWVSFSAAGLKVTESSTAQ